MKENTSARFAVKFHMRTPISSTFPFVPFCVDPDPTGIEVKRFESAEEGYNWILEKLKSYNAGDGAHDPFNELVANPKDAQVFDKVLSNMWNCDKVLHMFSSTSVNQFFCVCSLKEETAKESRTFLTARTSQVKVEP